jgi:hypothetical protein
MDPDMAQKIAFDAWKKTAAEAKRDKMKSDEQRKYEEELELERQAFLPDEEDERVSKSGPMDPEYIGEVYCRFTIFNVREINIKTQSILVDFYFEASWGMPSLMQEDGTLKAGSDIDWQSDDVWKPKTVFSNKLGEIEAEREWYDVVPAYLEKFGKPMASFRGKYQGEFQQSLDLRKFPYDGHKLEIIVATDWTTNVCNLSPNNITPSAAQLARFSIKDQWDLTFDGKTSVQCLPERKGATGSYSQLHLVIPAMRNPTYQLANTMLLMALTVLLFFFTVYSVRRDDIEDRMVIASNSVLTAVALKLLSAEQLPDLPYMTFLDKYMLFCIFLLIGLIFLMFIVDIVGKRDPFNFFVDQPQCTSNVRKIVTFRECFLDTLDFGMGYLGLLVWIGLNYNLFKPLLKRRGEAKNKDRCTRLSSTWTRCKSLLKCCSRREKADGAPS